MSQIGHGRSRKVRSVVGVSAGTRASPDTSDLPDAPGLACPKAGLTRRREPNQPTKPRARTGFPHSHSNHNSIKRFPSQTNQYIDTQVVMKNCGGPVGLRLKPRQTMPVTTDLLESGLGARILHHLWPCATCRISGRGCRRHAPGNLQAHFRHQGVEELGSQVTGLLRHCRAKSVGVSGRSPPVGIRAAATAASKSVRFRVASSGPVSVNPSRAT